MVDQVVTTFFQLECQLRLYHWHTTSFARHKASDEAIGHVLESMDTIVETLLGRLGRGRVLPSSASVPVRTLSDISIVKYLDFVCNYLTSWDSTEGLNSSDILNHRDELLGNLERVKYLMTLS